MGRNLAPEHGPKRGRPLDPPPAVLPLPDAREVLDPYWLGVAYWRTVLADDDWWRTCHWAPSPEPVLRDARHLHLITGVAIHIEDHSTCPIKRPAQCDRFGPQAWHAVPHSRTCPAGRPNRPHLTGAQLAVI